MEYTPKKTQLFHRPDLTSPLGRIANGGILLGTQGTGFREFRKHSMFGMIFLFNGEGRYRDTLGRDCALVPGDLICVRPDLPHQYGAEKGACWEELFITFEGPSFEPWFTGPGAPLTEAVLQLGAVDLWLPRFLALLEHQTLDEYQMTRSVLQLHDMLNEIHASSSCRDTMEQRLANSIRQLESWPPGQSIDWQSLASTVSLSYSAWRKQVKAHTGYSPTLYRRRHLMHQAAALLRQTRMTNEALAEQFGCTDAFHFSKLFKSVLGVSPRHFRQAIDHSRSGD